MPEINLLPQRRKGTFSSERLLLFTKVTAVACVILVASLSILFFLLGRDPTLSQQQQDQQATLAQLNLLQDKAAKYLVIIDRLGKIKTILANRSNFDTSMGTLISQIPSGITVSGFTMDKATYTLSLSGSDLSLISTTVDNFTKLLASKKILKSLTVQGLVTDEKNGTYVLTLSGTLL